LFSFIYIILDINFSKIFDDDDDDDDDDIYILELLI